jgi:dTDP-4-dehydrorhamnose 3,5-epimerase
MRVHKTKLEGVLLFKLESFEDFRGEYVEIFNESLYKREIVNNLKGTIFEKSARGIKFLEDDISTGSRGVLKGLHGDKKTWKLISCLYGKFYLVVLNQNHKSTDYGKWEAFTLSASNKNQVLIPPYFGNGHLVLSEYSIFAYKQTSYYDPKSQFTVKFNDPAFNIWWPIKNPILSQRDESGKVIKKS